MIDAKVHHVADIRRPQGVRAAEMGAVATCRANKKCKKSKTLTSGPPGVKIGRRVIPLCQKTAKN